MNLLRRHFKNLTILLITLIICLSVLLIVGSINDKVNGREPQSFSSSLRQLHPVDVPGVVKQVASRINGDLVGLNDVAHIEVGHDEYDDEDKSESDGSWKGDEDDLDGLYDDDDEDDEDDGKDDDDSDDEFDDRGVDDIIVKNADQVNKLEQLNLDPSLVKIKEKMIARQDHLHKECARLGMRKLNVDNSKDLQDIIAHKGNLDTLFWNDKSKFITSVNFKSGSGNWKKFLKALAATQGKVGNFPPQLQRAAYKPDEKLSLLARKPLEIKYRLKHYLKIVTVRHPLIRFLSGYRDKFLEHPEKYRKDIPKKIINSRTGDARASGPKSVTFSEFADLVTREPQATLHHGYNTDPHWTPQHIRSRPCEHDYDIIAKLETSDDDMDFIKRFVGINDKMSFLPEYTDRHEVSNNEELAISYFQQLSEETFQSVCDFYSLDFELFGYYRPKSVNDVGRIFDDFF